MCNPSTPNIIYSALVYVLLSIDIISAKNSPILGWVDEDSSIALAHKIVNSNLTHALEMQADGNPGIKGTGTFIWYVLMTYVGR